MAKTRPIKTNLSKGELSPKLEGRPDLAAYFEGGRTIENFLLLRQAGITRRPGLRRIVEVKESDSETIILPFQADVNTAYILELGTNYARFIRNKQQIMLDGSPYEIATPYTQAHLDTIHYTQSVDVMYLFNRLVAQQRLNRLGETDWSMLPINFEPPPTFEKDTILNAALALSANEGEDVTFRLSADVFFEADVDRPLISGVSRALLDTITNGKEAIGDILDAFTTEITVGPNPLTTLSAGDLLVTSTAHGLVVGEFVRLTSGAQLGEMRMVTLVPTPDTFNIDETFSGTQTNATWTRHVPIALGDWALGLSPQTTLNPTRSGPFGTLIKLAAGLDAFRGVDVGKYIHIYDGIVKITRRIDKRNVRGMIVSEMVDVGGNPDEVPAGAWSMQVSSWSDPTGYPGTGEFNEGRLVQASTITEPTTFWMSQSDDFQNYAIGVLASHAINYAIAGRHLNRIEWVGDQDELFLGTAGSVHRASGGREGEPLGGDIIPRVRSIGSDGCAPIQVVSLGKHLFYVDRSRQKIFLVAFNLEEDRLDTPEVTILSDHITGSGIKQGQIGVQNRLDPRLWFVRDDGQIVTLTFYRQEKVIGFTRIVTDGFFESIAIIPKPVGGGDEVYVVVKRILNGEVRRFIELFEDSADEITNRPWKAIYTDCAVIYSGSPVTEVNGLDHLENEDVMIVADGLYVGTQIVQDGKIQLQNPASEVEVGLPQVSTCETMRPAIRDVNIEGLPRSWDSIFVRLLDSRGGTANGQEIRYAPSALDTPTLFTGDRKVSGRGWDTDGRIRIVQNEPYPMTILSIYGELSLGDRG